MNAFLHDFLPPLLVWLAGTWLPLGALWLLFRLGLRAERCFGYNRALLLLAPVVAAGLPLLPHPALPLWPWPAASQAGADGFAVLLPTLGVAGGVGNASWAGGPWLLGLYGAGVALGLGRLAWQLWQLRRATRALPRAPHPGYELARTGGRLPTSSFGNTIFWDETAHLTAAEAASVLAHEQAHVRQGHSYDVLWLEVWRAVLWLNPFAHLLLPAVRLTHELLADREAATTASPTPLFAAEVPYRALLARLTARGAVGAAYSSLLQPFTFSFTLTRLAMLQNQTPVRRWKQWLILPMLAGLFLMASRPVSAQSAPSNHDTAWKETVTKNIKAALKQDSAVTGGKEFPGKMRRINVEDDGAVKITYENGALQMPELPGGGGPEAIVKAIQSNLIYPKREAGSTALEGRVFVAFTADTDGAVRDVKIVRSLNPAYDKAVMDAVYKLPRLTVRQEAGKPVPTSYTVPVQFAK